MDGAEVVEVFYQQTGTGVNATNVGLEITDNAGAITNPFTGTINAGGKYIDVSTAAVDLLTGDVLRVDVPSGIPDAVGLVAMLRIKIP